jgi:hypothetical protein
VPEPGSDLENLVNGTHLRRVNDPIQVVRVLQEILPE